MTSLLERLERMERDLRRLDSELIELRVELAGQERPEDQGQAPPLRVAAAPFLPESPVVEASPPERQPLPPPPPLPPQREPGFWDREFTLPRLEVSDLLGARGLAVAGGIVTLLGVVFFFALAASNGWIGPTERVLLGAAASTLVFTGGVFAQARYGRLDAAVAAAGAGLAGAYATLLFAAARYELVEPLTALSLAAGIATAGVALSLRWSSQLVAAFGLIGAMCVPAVALLDGDPTSTGTAFVALVLLGAAAVSVQRGWDALLLTAGAISVPQLVALVVEEGEPAGIPVLAVAAAFGLLYVGTGVARQIQAPTMRLDAVAGAFAGGSVGLTLLSSFVLLDGSARAVGLAAATVVYGALAAVAWRGEQELSAFAAAAGSALAAVALAQLLDGPALVVAWAAETAVLAWLGRRLGESRFQLLALTYLGVAFLYVLVVEAPPQLLFERDGDHLGGVPALLAVAFGAAAYGYLARAWPAPRGVETMPTFLRELVEDMHDQRPVLSAGALTLAAVLAVDSASLWLLELFEWMNVEPAFDWGHLAVTGLWSLIAVAVLTLGLRLGYAVLEAGGLVALGATIASYLFFGISELEPVVGWSALALAAACAGAALVHGLLGGRPHVVAAAAVGFSAGFSAAASVELLADDVQGYGLALAALSHLALAAAVWRTRELATWFWSSAVLLGVAASLVLLDGTWVVLALALGAAVTGVLGRFLAEPRLWLAAIALVGLAAGITLAALAEPADFLRAQAEPMGGVPALLLVVAALSMLLFSVGPFVPADGVDGWIGSEIEHARGALAWLLVGLGLYAASLSVLGLMEVVSTAGETTEFQRGHTAVSALWGVVAFAALLAGLRRDLGVLRLAGLGLFALALGKLFLYDLSTLSSITRALSFLAVGAVLLLAGFFYQRLSTEAEGR